MATKSKKPGPSAAIDSKHRLDPPLDFSFMHFADVSEICGEEPRCAVGKKPLVKNEDEKFDAKCLKLNNNMLTDLKDFHNILEKMLLDPFGVTWLDLSFNQLTTIDPVLCDLKSLQIAYLHGNIISDLKQVDKLAELGSLKKLALHGNPIENEKEYRFYLLNRIPSLTCIDMSPVTKSDRASAQTWKQRNPIKGKKKKSKD